MAHAIYAAVMLAVFAALTASDAWPREPSRLDPGNLHVSTQAGPRIAPEVEALEGATGKEQAVHTATDIPISAYARNPFAWLPFVGVQRNTDVFFKIAETMGRD